VLLAALEAVFAVTVEAVVLADDACVDLEDLAVAGSVAAVDEEAMRMAGS